MPTAVSPILEISAPPLWNVSAPDFWKRLWNRPQTVATAHPAYLSLARSGNPDALARLYDDYREPVWRLCRRLLRSEQDAEDVLQTTFVKAFAALPRFRADATLKTWLLRIAVNEANTVRRRRDTSELPPESPPCNPFDAAEQVAVRALVDALKPEFRTVLVLRFWEELSYDEIAAVLDISLPGVKMRLHRAKEAFRKQYETETP